MEEYIKKKDIIVAIMGSPSEAHYPSWYYGKIDDLSVYKFNYTDNSDELKSIFIKVCKSIHDFESKIDSAHDIGINLPDSYTDWIEPVIKLLEFITNAKVYEVADLRKCTLPKNKNWKRGTGELTMAEYIDKEVALSLIKPDRPEDKRNIVTIATAKELVRNIVYRTPTADVAPVIHGKWIDGAEDFTCGNRDAKCSICGCCISWNGCDEDFNYCPNCGAKMD